jgi:hypothetical protein
MARVVTSGFCNLRGEEVFANSLRDPGTADV